jgi:hypothetical protein
MSIISTEWICLDNAKAKRLEDEIADICADLQEGGKHGPKTQKRLRCLNRELSKLMVEKKYLTYLFYVPFTFYPESNNLEEIGPEVELIALVEAASREEAIKTAERTTNSQIQEIKRKRDMVGYGEALELELTGDPHVLYVTEEKF